MDKQAACSDCSRELNERLGKLKNGGGRVLLPSGTYPIYRSLLLDSSSACFAGEVWACNTDPNGVFETAHGTKIRMHGGDFSALVIGKDTSPISGALVRDLGVQGDIVGMDVRDLVDFENPQRAAGLCLRSVRTDQCEFSKMAFCGCASAVCATGDAEIDACIFEKLNTDGCGNGFYFAPRASYYTRVRACIMADNPYYGFYAGGAQRKIHNLQMTDCHFVRNGGAFREGDGHIPAAALLENISSCEVDHCLFDDPGTYWHYEKDAVKNGERQISHRKATALYVIGNKNRLTNNTFLHSSEASVRIVGDENTLMSTIADGSVHICGEGNTVVNLVFAKPEARLILEGRARQSTQVLGVPRERIAYADI